MMCRGIFSLWRTALWMCASVLYGCTHGRAISIVHIPETDAGIRTEAKYSVERIGLLLDGGSVMYLPVQYVEEFSAAAEKAYPGVFSDQGIPVALVRTVLEEDSDNSIALWFLSCQILPLCIRHESRAAWEIIFNQQLKNNPSFEASVVDEYHMSTFSPFAALVPRIEAEEHEPGKVFIQDYSGIGVNAEFINKEALSYGMASRLKEAETSGEIKPVMQAWRSSKQMDSERMSAAYTVVDCRKENGSQFCFLFVVKLHDDEQDALKAFRNVQKKFREEIKSNYLKTFSDVRSDSLYVDFPQYWLKDRLIVGRAEVLSFKSAELSYDVETRRGKLSVCFNPLQYETAHAWIRKNIETLARDSNIAHEPGQLPSGARYYSLGESVKDGNILEIEFKTE